MIDKIKKGCSPEAEKHATPWMQAPDAEVKTISVAGINVRNDPKQQAIKKHTLRVRMARQSVREWETGRRVLKKGGITVGRAQIWSSLSQPPTDREAD